MTTAAQATNHRIAIVIPSRLGSTRLPGKPLASFGGKTLVEHVWQQATASRLGDVLVATDDKGIADMVASFGGQAVMTPASCASGSDRCYAAIQHITETYDIIINLQGDMPFIKPQQIAETLTPLQSGFDIGTLIYPMTEAMQHQPHAVKAIVSLQDGIGRCHWFCRANLNYGYHHAGIYAYTRDALETFAKTPPSIHENLEKLEQLRALECGLTMGAQLTTAIAGEINTPEDLAAARQQHGN